VPVIKLAAIIISGIVASDNSIVSCPSSTLVAENKKYNPAKKVIMQILPVKFKK
jgi:hypothetical protein